MDIGLLVEWAELPPECDNKPGEHAIKIHHRDNGWWWFVPADTVGDEKDNNTGPFNTPAEAAQDLAIFLKDRS
jgi:hypothetical protein